MVDDGNVPVNVHLKLRSFETDLVLPPGTDILRAREPEAVRDVETAVFEALASPIGTPSLADLCREVLTRSGRMYGERASEPAAASETARPAPPGAAAGRRGGLSAAVVISDNTRAVPYKGEGGILWPLVESLLRAGFPAGSITLLVATGTHRVLTDEEIWALVDERVRRAGVQVRCHDAADPAGLTFVGRTDAGDDVFMDTAYVEADFRILTGMVEVHLMAGVSGGRKSICPGLVDVRSVRGFHGPATVAHSKATALVLEGNPSHEVALEIAGMARPDFILNVTTRQDGRVAGVFAGDMEKAHLAAVEHVRSFVQIPLEREYDVVVTHGGMVGINHYQAQKACDIAAKAVRTGGYLVVVADTTEPDPVGTGSYRRLLALLKELGPEALIAKLQSKDWEFVHDQWGVQEWAHLLRKIPPEHIFYFSPQTAPADYAALPGVDPGPLPAGAEDVGPAGLARHFVETAVARACEESQAASGRVPAVAYLADGPHGVPVAPGAVTG
ncbi:MAG: lactate racemase domain-containing protein [Actinomycetia bacterium]|nr:lactate racemase domain-containing protein [Actinomycetes bacterium]